MTHLAYIRPLLFRAGDRLTREEFLELWESMPNLKFAELIDGVVYLPSPVSLEHGQKDSLVQVWAGTYAARAGRIDVVSNATWLMEKSAPQPDLAMRIKPQFGGQSGSAGELAEGAPEFVAEVCYSSRSYDLGPKLQLYERSGVQEYLAVLIKERRIEWRVQKDGSFHLLQPNDTGIYQSIIFPGLWLDEPAFWSNDISSVIAVVERGLQSPEFIAFRERFR